MALYEIKFNRYDGWSYDENGAEIDVVESDMVELSDDEEQTLIALMKQHNTYDVSELNLKASHPTIYKKLSESCETIAFNIVVAEALRDACFDGADDFEDRLCDYCERKCGYDESLGDFNRWFYNYAKTLNKRQISSLYSNAGIDVWDEVLDYDGMEIPDYEVTIPQAIVAKAFDLA